jgi:hypothetical protein
MKWVEDGLWVTMTEIELLGCCSHVYPVGTLQVRFELPLAQFQDFLIALMPPIPCVVVLGLDIQEWQHNVKTTS